MPNWCFNGLTIEGNPDSVNNLIAQMNKPFVMTHDSWNMENKEMEAIQTTYSNPVFAFHNIWNHRLENITDLEYTQQMPKSTLPVEDGQWWEDTQKIALVDNSWYNWNTRNWGTKWDVAVSEDNEFPDTYMETQDNGENKVVFYNFQTAWAPPIPAMEKLSAQYPSLLLTLSYEEETGWGGECEFLGGEITSQSDYDNKCRDCDSENTMEYCDNDCGEICSSCNYLAEADLEAVAECQTHKIYLDTNVPEYRKDK